MAEAHRRAKNPQQVRERLIKAARELALEQGLTAISVGAVATKAGVTKGGLFHHFANKQTLVDAVFEHMLAELEAKLIGLMAADQEPKGCFTRAYLEAAFDGAELRWGPIWMATLTDHTLRSKWNCWYAGMADRHDENSPTLKIVRLAADGVWLSSLIGDPPKDPARLKDMIASMTRGIA